MKKEAVSIPAPSEAERLAFDGVCRRILSDGRRESGIGTLGERTLHAILKTWLEPDLTRHEIKVGRYVADICRQDEILEIQTRDFSNLRSKLAAFTPDYRVTVVYPIDTVKYLSWIQPETGEITSRRKSPRHGMPWEILRELYRLRPIMPLTNVRFQLVFLEVEEFRSLNGWSRDGKRGSSRFERIPTALAGTMMLEAPGDYLSLVPASLPERFTAADFARASGFTQHIAGNSIRTLCTLGVLEHTDTQKQKYIYERILTP